METVPITFVAHGLPSTFMPNNSIAVKYACFSKSCTIFHHKIFVLGMQFKPTKMHNLRTHCSVQPTMYIYGLTNAKTSTLQNQGQDLGHFEKCHWYPLQCPNSRIQGLM
ncbi:unnamed protein product [Ixodes pacificus]